jgi:hypothetical protein
MTQIYNPIHIGCIVEGHGDVQALPVVVRRVVHCIDPTIALRTDHVVRIPKSSILKPPNLEKGIELIARKIGTSCGILVLLDSDDDCPATLGPQLRDRAYQCRPDLPIGVVLAHREFEAWFLASAESLRGCRGLPHDLVAPKSPDAIRDAKGWLNRHSKPNGYAETVDQLEFARSFSISVARGLDSFDKCCREIERLVSVLR